MFLVSIECNYLFNYATFYSLIQHGHKASWNSYNTTHTFNVEKFFIFL